MANEVAFFKFDQNADKVAAQIDAAMARINSSLRRPLPGDIGRETGAFGKGFVRLNEDAKKAEAQLNSLFNSFSNGMLSRGDLRKGVRDVAKRAFGEIPLVMGDTLGKMEEVYASKFPARRVASGWASSLQASLVEQIKLASPAVQAALKGIDGGYLQRFVGNVAVSPVDYTKGDSMAVLRNRVRAEALVQRDLEGKNPKINRLIDELGMRQLTDQIRAAQVKSVPIPGGGANRERPVFTPSDAKEQLAALTREQAKATTIGERLRRETERQAAADQAAARAKDVLLGKYRMVNATQAVGPTGDVLRRSTQGFVPEANPFTRQKSIDSLAAMEERARNVQRIIGEIDAGNAKSMRGGAYWVTGQGLDREIFTKTGERVQNELMVKQLLMEHNVLMEKEIAKATRLNELSAKQAQFEANANDPISAFMGRFSRNGGGFMTTMATQVASAAAFSMAYGSIFALSGALHQVLADFLDYQDSITDLEVATRSADVVTQDWINSLGELARMSGSNTGAAADAAARGVRAFTSAGDPGQFVRDAGTATAREATRLSLIANKKMPDATGDVLAVGTAFGLKPDQLEQVTDAVANAKRTVGGDAAQISQGLALIALSAQNAGYTLNEAAAVIGLVQARTDQSGQAIATRLTRIFQILSGSTGKQLARDLNVDPNMLPKDQFSAYAKIYSNPGTSEGTKDRITSALGGTANLRELLPLLKEDTKLQNAFKEALNNAGQSTDEWERKLKNLVGTLTLLKGDIKQFSIGLATSGIFDVFGLMVKGIEPALHGLEQMIKLYSKLYTLIPGGKEGKGKDAQNQTGAVGQAVKTLTGLMLDIGIASAVIGAVVTRRAGAAGAARTTAMGSLAGTPLIMAAKSPLATQEVRVAASAAKVEMEAAAGAAFIAAQNKQTMDLVVASEKRGLAEQALTGTVVVSAEERLMAERVAAGTAMAGGEMAGAGLAAGGIAGRVGASGMALGARALAGAIFNIPMLIVAGIVGGFALYGKISEQNQTRDTMRTDVRKAFRRPYERALEADTLSSGLYAAAQDLNSKAGNLKKTQTGVGSYGPTRDMLVAELKGRSKALTWMAERVQQEELYAAQLKGTAYFADRAIGSVQDLNAGLQNIAAAGGTALTQLRAFRRALMEPAPDGGQTYWRPEELKATVVDKLISTLGSSIPEGTTATVPVGTSIYGVRGGGAGVIDSTRTTTNWTEIQGSIPLKTKDTKAMFAAMDAKIAELGLDPSKGLTEADMTQIVNAALSAVDMSSVTSFQKQLLEGWAANAVTALTDPNAGMNPELPGLPADVQRALNSEALSASQILQILNPGTPTADGQPAYAGAPAILDQGLAAIPANDDGSIREAELKRNFEFLKNLKGKYHGRKLAQLETELAARETAYRDFAVQRADDLRLAAESGARSTASLRAIRLKYAKVEVAKAGTNKNLLKRIFESLDRATIKTIIQGQRDTVAAAQLSYASAKLAAKAAIKAAGTNITILDHILDGLNQYAAALEEAKAALAAMESAFGSATISADTATYDGGGGGGESAAQKHANMVAAKAEAHAAKVGGALAAARASLKGARAALNAAKKGTVEWWQALAGFYQAQWELKGAIEDYHHILRQLNGDFTDPVEQARDELRRAREHLRNAVAKDEKASARLDVKQSEAALEKAKWDQKLSDMQIAEQLGRISSATYIQYLEREKARMEAIRNKTRQQIDYYNQISLALKDAQGAMSGMFNIGDIDTRGFVYQVRRAVAQAAATASTPTAASLQSTATTVTNNTVTINGTDINMVRQVLSEMLGSTAATSTTSTRRVS